jgi:hypothetical protein
VNKKRSLSKHGEERRSPAPQASTDNKQMVVAPCNKKKIIINKSREHHNR